MWRTHCLDQKRWVKYPGSPQGPVRHALRPTHKTKRTNHLSALPTMQGLLPNAPALLCHVFAALAYLDQACISLCLGLVAPRQRFLTSASGTCSSRRRCESRPDPRRKAGMHFALGSYFCCAPEEKKTTQKMHKKVHPAEMTSSPDHLTTRAAQSCNRTR